MSTNLPQSQWLDKVARRIEQECPKCGGRGIQVVDVPFESGQNLEDCGACHGSGVVRVPTLKEE